MGRLRGALIAGYISMVFGSLAFAQTIGGKKPVECKGKLKASGKFTILNVGTGADGALRVKIIIRPRDQTDENYLAIVNRFKLKYCKEDKMYLAIFDSKDHKKLDSIPQPERPIDGTPRALYVFDRATGREVLQIYKIVDGKIETRELEASRGQSTVRPQR